MVADVNHDGASDVLVIAYQDPPLSFSGTIPAFGILCALSGAGDCESGPKEIFCTDPADTEHLLNSWGHLAVADLDATDGNDALTIIAGLHRGASGGLGVVAFTERGEVLWEGHDATGAPVDVFYYGGAPAIADLEGDGRAEIIIGGTVFDADGQLVWRSPIAHIGNAAWGPMSLAVDLDGTGGPLEVITGNTAYESTGAVRWTSSVIGDGYPAIADFDRDGRPEIVVVENGRIAILNRDGTAFAPTLAFNTLFVNSAPVTGRGGTPTIADIDGDGRPEIGVGVANAYLALRVTSAPAIELAWAVPVNDQSSNIAASAMFDFDGNGISEIIYQDTCRTRVFAGVDGEVVIDIENSSGTSSNYPTVADLNGDGRAEFILVADSFYARAYPASTFGCPPAMPLTDGVRVYRDANDNWHSTRAIWNQHTYHVSNVCDGVDSACSDEENHHGAVPRHEAASWMSTGVDGYRINARFGANESDAPDLLPIGIVADLKNCPFEFTLHADIANQGAAAVAAGTRVSFYEQTAAGEHILLGVVELERALPPGGVARASLAVSIENPAHGASLQVYVVADDDGTGNGRTRECNESNNTSTPIRVDCTLI
jgi:hypothetical protein